MEQKKRCPKIGQPKKKGTKKPKQPKVSLKRIRLPKPARPTTIHIHIAMLTE